MCILVTGQEFNHLCSKAWEDGMQQYIVHSPSRMFEKVAKNFLSFMLPPTSFTQKQMNLFMVIYSSVDLLVASILGLCSIPLTCFNSIRI